MSTRSAGRRSTLAVALVALALAPAIVLGQGRGKSGGAAPTQPPRVSVPRGLPRPAATPFVVRARVDPAIAELGQRVTYRAWVSSQSQHATARWLRPDTSAAFTWGRMNVLRRSWLGRKPVETTGRYAISGWETLFVEIPLQAFALGKLTVPGIPIEIDDGRGPRPYRLPISTLTVVPTLTAADSNADFRAVHGPLAAPWWERVPWGWVLLGLALVAAVVAAWWAWRRRRPVAVPAPAPAASDPRTEALAALAALRALRLPEHGRFPEHAFRLGQILRRYLEAVTGVTHPGDTTPELVRHLKLSGLEAEDVNRLAGLLRAWDQVKFAREPYTLDEAVRAERATEAFLRRPSIPAPTPGVPVGKVA